MTTYPVFATVDINEVAAGQVRVDTDGWELA